MARNKQDQQEQIDKEPIDQEQIDQEPIDQGPMEDPQEKKTGIETVEQLRSAYPNLVRQIIEDGRDWFKNRTAQQIQNHFPQLYARIAEQIKGQAMVDLKVPGFLLASGDPFAAGTLRTFASLKNRAGLHLPFVLPFKDKDTPQVLKGYIIRAEGGGDFDRAKKARKALDKCK